MHSQSSNSSGGRRRRLRERSASAILECRLATATSAGEALSAASEILIERNAIFGRTPLRNRLNVVLDWCSITLQASRSVNQDFLVVPKPSSREKSVDGGCFVPNVDEDDDGDAIDEGDNDDDDEDDDDDDESYAAGDHSASSESDDDDGGDSESSSPSVVVTAGTSDEADEDFPLTPPDRALFADDRVPLFAVLDGHGPDGETASKVSASAFVQQFSRTLRLRSAVQHANGQLLAVTPPNLDNGTTIIACAVSPTTGLVHCANVGDSRAVLVRGAAATPPYHVEPMSIDHNLTRRDEAQRVVEEGGLVILYDGVRRMVPGPPFTLSDVYSKGLALSMTRALGHVVLSRFGVSPVPELRQTKEPLRPGDCLVLASDGLFDRLSSSDVAEAVKSVSGRGASGHPPSGPSTPSPRRILAALLFQLGRRSGGVSAAHADDNTSIVVVVASRRRPSVDNRPPSPRI